MASIFFCNVPVAHQAMWAWVVSLPVTLANFSPARTVPMGVGGWACAGLFAAGLIMESVADYQVRSRVIGVLCQDKKQKPPHVAREESNAQLVKHRLPLIYVTISGTLRVYILPFSTICCWRRVRACSHRSSLSYLRRKQKFQFKSDPKNKGKFVDSGLWSISRHPNYLGELTVWWGILGVAVPALR